jgi:aminopeptidase N
MRYLIFILLLTSFVYSQAPTIEPGVSRDLAIWRAAHYSDVRYKLNVTLGKMSPVLKGTIEIRVNLTGPQASRLQAEPARSEPGAVATGFLTPIILDWRKLPGHEKESTISNVFINGSTAVLSSNFSWPLGKDEPAKAGTPNEYYEANEHLIFSDGVVAGENVIKLDFTSPILTSGSAITRYVDKEDGAEYIYSLFVPSDASTAFPVFDQPDLKARFTLGIQMPVGWQVISNGVWNGLSSTDGGETLPRGISFEEIIGSPVRRAPNTEERSYYRGFEETKPISTYVFAFAAGPWERVSSPHVSEGSTQNSSNVEPSLTVGLQTPGTNIYVRKSQAAKFKPHAAEVFRLTREGIKYLETYFDYKFPFPKYDLVLIPEFPFGGMEHAGATFVRESSIIFPQEPTKNDYITRANLIFHETAHQWFGDTVTMKWFDDLWLKEGFAEFMAYKTLEKVMPEYNAWKVFYERNKQAAYLTDSTKGTTPIYQPIANLSAAKSAYGNIVYRKAPSFLRQAEFYLGEDKFQTAVRAFLKKHEFGNAGWEDLVKEFEDAAFAWRIRGWTYFPKMSKTDQDLFENKFRKEIREFAERWVRQRGLPLIRGKFIGGSADFEQENLLGEDTVWDMAFIFVQDYGTPSKKIEHKIPFSGKFASVVGSHTFYGDDNYIFPNYRDFGYGIFLLDDKSRNYVLKNIQNEKDDFLRSMMWGSLWDSVREAELDPKEYVELVIRNLAFTRSSAPKKTPKGVTLNLGETDESTIATLLGRVSTAMNYYLSDAQRSEITPRLEELLLDKLQNASTPGQRITYYRTYISIASTPKAHEVLKQMLASAGTPARQVAGKTPAVQSRTKDKFDIVTRLAILGDADAPRLLADLEKTETSDDAKRYAYAARAGFENIRNKSKYWDDFVNNKSISESWIESAIGPFNSIRHSDLTAQYLERSLAELPSLKRSRKIFFINNWLAAFIGGQRSESALAVINKFFDKNPTLDKDLRLKILENSDLIERAVRIRNRFK